MKLQIYTVDAFADRPFCGNPAAVVPLLQYLPDSTLQDVATEMNLSETAYVRPLEGSEGGGEDAWLNNRQFSLRWFTPTNEVALCGHATLATAHVLFHHLGNKNYQIEFETKSGILTAERRGRSIALDFPNNAPEEDALHPTLKADLDNLVKAIVGGRGGRGGGGGLSVKEAVKEVRISNTTKKLLVRLQDSCTREDLESLHPEAGVLMSLHDGSVVKGVIVTLRGQLPLEEKEKNDEDDPEKEKQYHVLSRYFAPWNGIPEDPVTGSAHTVLGPYWAQQLGISTLICRQCSPRGGDIEVTVRTDGRVDLSGQATTVIQGSFEI